MQSRDSSADAPKPSTSGDVEEGPSSSMAAGVQDMSDVDIDSSVEGSISLSDEDEEGSEESATLTLSTSVSDGAAEVKVESNNSEGSNESAGRMETDDRDATTVGKGCRQVKKEDKVSKEEDEPVLGKRRSTRAKRVDYAALALEYSGEQEEEEDESFGSEAAVDLVTNDEATNSGSVSSAGKHGSKKRMRSSRASRVRYDDMYVPGNDEDSDDDYCPKEKKGSDSEGSAQSSSSEEQSTDEEESAGSVVQRNVPVQKDVAKIDRAFQMLTGKVVDEGSCSKTPSSFEMEKSHTKNAHRKQLAWTTEWLNYFNGRQREIKQRKQRAERMDAELETAVLGLNIAKGHMAADVGAMRKRIKDILELPTFQNADRVSLSDFSKIQQNWLNEQQQQPPQKAGQAANKAYESATVNEMIIRMSKCKQCNSIYPAKGGGSAEHKEVNGSVRAWDTGNRQAGLCQACVKKYPRPKSVIITQKPVIKPKKSNHFQN